MNDHIILDYGSVQITNRGLKVVEKSALTFETLTEVWETTSVMLEMAPWVIGDAHNLGEDLYPDLVTQLITAKRISRKRVQNYAWVCRRFHDWRWRRPADVLSFSHHEAVAGLMNEGEEALKFALSLLTAAVKDDLGVEWVEARVREFRGEEEVVTADGEEVAFSTGPPLARLERLHAGVGKLLKDAPVEWDVEVEMLEAAEGNLSRALRSAQNRKVGDAELVADA